MNLASALSSLGKGEMIETPGIFYGLDKKEPLLWEVVETRNQHNVITCDLFYFGIRLKRVFARVEGDKVIIHSGV